MITANQLRAARALLDLSQGAVAEAVGVSPNTISNIEKGSRPAHDTLTRLQGYFESHGVEFTESEGVRKKPSGIITYRGRDGFAEFMWDVYETIKKFGGEICVSNVDETTFSEHLGSEVDSAYTEKMNKLSNEIQFDFKILIKEGDTNFVASNYATYRWISANHFQTVPFYVYGEKLAFLLFGESVTIHLIENAEIAAAQRVQFNLAWEKSSPPEYKNA